MKHPFFLLAAIGLLLAVACQTKPSETAVTTELSDDSLLTLVQQRTFEYFWDGAEPNSGCARERFHVDNDYPDNDKHIITSGGTGFGLMTILVGIERKFVTREQAVERFERIFSFLEKADRFHGVWPHWINGETGKAKPFSSKDDAADLVETSYLAQGMLCVRQYFQGGNAREQALAAKVDQLWREIEWDWHRNGKNVLYWHWSPTHQWQMNFAIEGYNECLITYIMAAASPTHTIPAEVYHEGWARGGKIKNDTAHRAFGYHLALRHNDSPQNGGALFWSHYSFLGLDPRKLKDAYADYWQHNRNHVLSNRAYCIQNPKGYKGYGPDSWGLTSSYSIRFYAAHRPDEDMGVISPTAALSSFPYTPKESMEALRYFYYKQSSKLWGPYGFYDAFSEHYDWVKPWYLAIDQGPIVVMMENYRTGLLWNLFMSAPEVKTGLNKLGFSYK
jgi:hypothetical protein